MTPKTDIFIRAYPKDLKWFKYCLDSIELFARDFGMVNVVCTEQDKSAILTSLVGRHNTVLHLDPPNGGGWIEQQLSKFNSDRYTDADFICHFDMDCIFTEPVTPLDYFTDGKPDLWYDEYDGPNLRDHPGVQAYRPTTAKALGLPVSDVTVETLRRFPIVYPRWLYKATRERIEKTHGIPIAEYIKRNIGGMGECNVLGFWGYKTRPEEFALWHMNNYCNKPPKLKQYWSHSGMMAAEEAEIQATLAKGRP